VDQRLGRVEHPVALFSNGLGDALLTLPTVRALAALFPGRLTLLCPGRDKRLCYQFVALRQCLELPRATTPDANDGDPRQFDVAAAAAAVDGCDLFLSLVPWYARSLDELVLRLMPHTTIGPHPAFDRTAAREPGMHYADQVFQVAKECAPGLRLEDFAKGPRVAPAAWRQARAFRARLPRGARVLAIHPDPAACWKSEKEWQPAKFVEVLEAFLGRHHEYFAFVVGRCYDKLERGKHADRIICCLGLPLDLTVALVGTADLFLGVNSGMLHAADLFHVPSVGLFGPEDGQHGWRDWGLRFAPGRNVSARRSVKDIEVGPVLEALDDLIQSGPSGWSRGPAVGGDV
jgi:hypothetical protein